MRQTRTFIIAKKLHPALHVQRQTFCKYDPEDNICTGREHPGRQAVSMHYISSKKILNESMYWSILKKDLISLAEMDGKDNKPKHGATIQCYLSIQAPHHANSDLKDIKFSKKFASPCKAFSSSLLSDSAFKSTRCQEKL